MRSVGTITAKYLQDLLIDLNIDIGMTPENDVNVFSIVYETVDWNDQPREASGALYIPDIETSNGFPLLSSHHGTVTKRDNVASVTPLLGFEALMGASTGYLTCSPDYLGLGVSTDVFHPFIHISVVDGVIDFVRAARNYSCENDIVLNGQLFLSGYSEGGYVTMATHKAMEEQFPDEFVITASAPMAGPYDVLGTAFELFAETTFSYPSYFGYVVAAYSTIYGWDRMDEFFQSPYAEMIQDLYDGTHTLGQINDALTTVVEDLFQTKFMVDFTGEGEQEIKTAFRENSLLDWTPRAPIRIFHGDADDAVPYSNAQRVLEELSAKGGATIELVTIPGADHAGAVLPSIAGAKKWFDTFKE